MNTYQTARIGEAESRAGAPRTHRPFGPASFKATCGALLILPLLVSACATTGNRQFQPASATEGIEQVSEADRKTCEEFARTEAEVAWRDAQGFLQAERENLAGEAATWLSKSESLGYHEWRSGSTVASVDARLITAGVAVLLIIPKGLVGQIKWLADSTHKKRMVYDTSKRDCLKAAAHSLRPDTVDLAKTLQELGIRFLLQGKYSDAERMFRRVLAIRGEDLFPTHTAAAAGLQSLAGAYEARGQHSDAVRVQAWLRQPIGSDEPTRVEAARQPAASGGNRSVPSSAGGNR